MGSCGRRSAVLLGAGLIVAVLAGRAADAWANGRVGWTVLYSGTAAPRLSAPAGLAIDKRGAGAKKWMYVVDGGHDRVVKLGTGGRYLLSWGSRGSGPGQFQHPDGIATDGDGDVYVADTGNNRVEKFGPRGQFLAQWGSGGTAPGEFDAPAGIAVGGSGNVFVADRGNRRIEKFSSGGQLLAVWSIAIPAHIGQPGFSSGTGPYVLSIDGGGNVYTATDTGQCSGGHCVMDFIMLQARSPAGTVRWSFVGSGPYGGADFPRQGPWWQIGAVAADGHGHLLLSEWNPQNVASVTELSSTTSRQLASWTLPQPSGSNGWPGRGIACDPHGNIYVADTLGNRVLKLAR